MAQMHSSATLMQSVTVRDTSLQMNTFIGAQPLTRNHLIKVSARSGTPYGNQPLGKHFYFIFLSIRIHPYKFCAE